VKRRNTLKQQASLLERRLRQVLPNYAIEHLDPALQGDADEAHSLVVAAPNSLRGDIAVLFYLRGSSLDVQRAGLSAAWLHDHEHVIRAAGRESRLKAMFRAAQFELPPSIPEIVTLWRGGIGSGGAATHGH
jgi:hypothetical protein